MVYDFSKLNGVVLTEDEVADVAAEISHKILDSPSGQEAVKSINKILETEFEKREKAAEQRGYEKGYNEGVTVGKINGLAQAIELLK